MDRNSFQVFEGAQGLAVLETMVELLCHGKFLGPFPPSMLGWNGFEFIYSPLFCLEKGDSTTLKPKHRTIYNAAAQRPKTQFQLDVLNGLYDNHPDFLEFWSLAHISTLNEAMVKRGVSLDSVKEIIRGMYLSK